MDGGTVVSDKDQGTSGKADRQDSGVMRRRAFLAAAGAFGLAGGLARGRSPSPGGSQGAPAGTGWRMRLSTSSIHYIKLPIEQVCERIAALGFEAIDIWSAHEKCPHLDDVAKRLGGAGLRELLARHRLKLFAFSTYAGGYERYAKLLGAAGGGVAIRSSTGACKPEELTSRMKAFLKGLEPLAELAEKYNSHVAIENHGNALLNTLDSFKAFVDLNRSPRIGIALAPYHVQGLKASVEEAIAISGKQLFFFYAWQRQPGVKQLPGHGPTDFTPWIAALAKAGYRGYVNPFMHGHPDPETMSAALAKSRDYLRACYTKAMGEGGSA